MKARWRVGPAAVVLLAVAARAPLAQVPYRGGLWADLGIGPGRMRLSCTTCATMAIANGVAITASLGGAPSRNVLLGVQAQSWIGTTGSREQQVRSLLAIVQWYPWETAGFFVRAGTGVVEGPVTPAQTGVQPATVQNTGIGLEMGAGWDFPVTRHLGLTLQAGWHVAALGDLVVNGVAANDVIANVYRVGAAVVLR